MKVAEVFGPTVQGEGPSLGRRCSFIRLGRCNLSCSWCDTPFTWDWRGKNGTRYDPAVELHDRDVASLVEQVASQGTDMVVITGGEPFVQHNATTNLAQACKHQGWRVEVETNGTIAPGNATLYVDRFNISPKLSNAGMHETTRITYPVLQAFASLPADQAAFKFVVTNTTELDEVDNIVRHGRINPNQVWVMPEGRDPATITTRNTTLTDEVVSRGYNTTTRLHVLVWGDKRGV